MSQTRYASKKRRPSTTTTPEREVVTPHWRPSRPAVEAAVASPASIGERLLGVSRGFSVSDRQLIRELIEALRTNVAVMRGEDPDTFVPPPTGLTPVDDAAEATDTEAAETATETEDDAAPLSA